MTLLVKLYDLHVSASVLPRPAWAAFAAFLPNCASVVLRKLDSEPRPEPRENFIRLARRVIELAFAGAILVEVFRIDWSDTPFALEHSVKVAAFFLVLIPGTAVMVALWRLPGGKCRDFMDAPFMSRTPADFWRRYNRPTQQFFHEDIFKPAGGWRHPIRATRLTFVISALVHEYVFSIAIGRIEGYQTLFFLLQGCASAATVRVKPKGWAAIPWIAGTLAFNLATSTLFFASVNSLVPFYSSNR